MSKYIEIDTDLGRIRGNEREECLEFLGIKYAKAKRFEYAKQVEGWDGTYDATAFGDACSQYRTYFPHLDVPERRFYHREFREGLDFSYSEDCLNLNIYTPKNAHNAPVLVFIHGGGFNSMANSEGYLDGEAYAKRGLILVCVNYRVGVFGYMTHRQIQDEF
jgi:para-nitrobenzyl esterase